MLKDLPIGTSNFRELINKKQYYVDKTEMIENLLKQRNAVSLFPRPRRFGKSLFISMLDNFFNIEYKDRNKNLFDGLYISKSEFYNNLSTRPVIKLNFRDLKKNTYEEMFNKFKEMIMQVYKGKKYIYNSLDELDKRMFDSFINKTADYDNYCNSVKYLTEMMYKYYGMNVVVLIDEYDVPIETGYINKYYKKVVSLIRDVFSSALKDNDFLDFGIMTGVLRVSKESLFSDFNNPKIYTIIDKNYNEAFGFTTEETKELLNYYNLELNEDVKNMYDGYNFGGKEIYNPWSIINYVHSLDLIPYWVNTSGNELIINTVKNCEPDIKVKIEKLLLGESLEFIYNDKTTYQDYSDYNDSDKILNLLLDSGYLTIEKRINKNFNVEMTYVKLPNREVRYLFSEILLKILTEGNRIDLKKVNDFCDGIFENDKEAIEGVLNQMLPKLSYHDLNESGYHNYVMALFTLFINDNNYLVYSNRESGMGRFDIMIKDKQFNKGIIIEFKVTKDDLEKSAINALNQIEEKEYYLDLVNEGYKEIIKYAIVFKGKQCIVR